MLLIKVKRKNYILFVQQEMLKGMVKISAVIVLNVPFVDDYVCTALYKRSPLFKGYNQEYTYYCKE